MQKTLALFLVLVSLFTYAFADEAAVEPMYFAPETAAEFPGEFVSLDELGLMMYVPEDFQIMKPEDVPEIYCVMGNADGIAISIMVYTLADLEVPADVTTLDALCEFFSTEGNMAGAFTNTINDLPCIMWENTEMDTAIVTYMTEAGNVLMFTYMPITNADLATQLGVIMTSVMPIPAE